MNVGSSSNQASAKAPKTSHTPGPWSVAPGGYAINATNHWRITAQSPHLAGKMQTVCELNGPWDEANYQANANLICAAPDLLEACKAVLRGLETGSVREKKNMRPGPPENCFIPSLADLIRAAIAKAKP